MQDLNVLHENKNFHEFFDHALDVLPSNRKAQWKEMVENSGVDYLSTIISKTKLENKDINLISKISLWPSLSKNEFYNKKRDHIFLKQVKLCFQSQEKDCFTLTKAIYNDFKHENSFVFELLKILKSQNITHQQIWPYARIISSNKFGEFYCNKEPLKTILTQELLTQTSKKLINTDDFNKDCIKTISKSLSKNLISNSPSNRSMSHTVLTQYGLLASTDKGKFEIISLIDGKSFSPSEFDKVLSVLVDFAKSDVKRNSLIAQYKRLDPLPDGLFSNTNSKQVKAKIKIIHRHFPEIIDAYALRCLSYLQGSKEYLNGNPTPNCHKFFKTAALLKILPVSFISKYNKATYFLKK
jgi:hypothetical protein